MRPSTRILVAVFVVALGASASFGDVPNPARRSTRPHAPVLDQAGVVINQGDSPIATLQIPRATLQQLAAQAAIGNKGETPSGAGSASAPRGVVAGLFLSLAFASLGLWLLRRKRSSILEAAAAIGLMGLMSATAFADIRGPYFSGRGGGSGLIMAGLFLSLSIIVAGLWLIRYWRKGGTRWKGWVIAAAMATALFVLIGVASVAIGAPSAKSRDPGTLPQALVNGKALSGQARIQIVDSGSDIVLSLPAAPAKPGK
ncbi:MAG TPA: hypothetical protein VJX67_13105 [Blastocatellia bacterium]|nr:hypothetical protein [Blastocatellia bacterium]